MNELIEELRRKLNKGETTFGDAIQIACKAQRNACVRESPYLINSQTYNKIKSAEIKRQDYENN